MIIIAAMTERRIIGDHDHLPWNIPEEFQAFQDRIRGETVVIGRRSWEIFGPELTSRHTIVVTRQPNGIHGAHLAHSMDAACRLAESLGFETYCAGGEQIYSEAIELANRMCLSHVKGEFDGDRRFPRFDPQEWEIVREEDRPRYVRRELRRIAG